MTDPILTNVVLRRSRNNMAKTLNHLQITLRRTPEWELDKRDKLTRKIELLKIIRGELKTLMQQL